jgi:AraC-like DNA-binding protein
MRAMPPTPPTLAPFSAVHCAPAPAACAPGPAQIPDGGGDDAATDPRIAPGEGPLAAPRASMARRVLRVTADGQMLQPPALPGVILIRSDRPFDNPCSVYEPCVAVILQGRKRVLLGAEVLEYGADRYLVAAMDMPVKSAVIEADAGRPYLAVTLRLDWRELAALMLEVPRPPAGTPGTTAAAPAAPPGAADARDREARALRTAVPTRALLDAFDRLLALLDQPEHAPALAPLIVREIHYRLLTGELGAHLRRMLSVDGQAHQVARAVSRLNREFARPLRVDELARDAAMSASTFHQRFKQLTAMSPLQYQKQLRLNEARRLMLSEGLDAATAAYRVGYESPSQFSREYSRQFGAPPSRDVGRLRLRGDAPDLHA